VTGAKPGCGLGDAFVQWHGGQARGLKQDLPILVGQLRLSFAERMNQDLHQCDEGSHDPELAALRRFKEGPDLGKVSRVFLDEVDQWSGVQSDG
jgi:hypothetical protein